MTRNQEIKALLKEFKAHLKGTKGDVRKAAASYFKPAPAKKKRTRTKA